ncbi:hypothetical protein L915_17014, partial [Phytophthora nicotianae]
MARERWSAAPITNEGAAAHAHLEVEVEATDESTNAAPPSLRRPTLHRLAAGADPRTRVPGAGRRGRNQITRKRRGNTEALGTKNANESLPSPKRERKSIKRVTVDTNATTARPRPLRHRTRTPFAVPFQARKSSGSWIGRPQTCRTKRVANSCCSSTTACLT